MLMPFKHKGYAGHRNSISSRSYGFTLIELIIFIVIVGIATTGLFSAINQHNLSSVDPIYQVRALELAQARLDEIIGKRYDENSPNGGFPPCDSGETGAVACDSLNAADAADLDDVDDYHGFNTVPASYSGFTLNVNVSGQILSGQPTKLIRVTVTPPVGEPVDLSAYKANF